MLNKLDFTKIQTILEPAAGKCDLVEGIKKKFELTQRYRHTKKYDIDCIEISEPLQHIIRGKGFRLIHDDFLSFHSYKKYDAIIANFPFSIGDKMLLHAINLQQRGGSIVALINGDTLRNPYSNTRKELIRLLDKYKADVEFIDNAFVNSERSTNVQTALVSMTIPKMEYNSVIVDELKKEETYSSNTYNSTHLIESDFIKGIVAQYEYEVKAGLRLIDEYNSLVPLMLRKFDGSNPVLKLELEYKDNEGSSLENAYIKQIRSKYWSALFNNEQFMGLFTSNLKEKYNSMVEELKDYDFSFYNIYTLRIQLSKEMVQGVEDTILNLFDEFSHKHYYSEMSSNIHLYNGWKSNGAYKINKKVIIPLNGFYDLQYSWGRYEPTNYKCLDKLKDIEKVFVYLDQDKTEHIDLKEALVNAEKSGKTKKIETDFFYITFFKKGTCHLEFKNLDLLHKFNLFGSQKKNWLPPSYGKEKYTNMSNEEKEVIDQFEGKESYNKVMNNQSYYIVKTEELLRLTS
jgi:hypothetical protein